MRFLRSLRTAARRAVLTLCCIGGAASLRADVVDFSTPAITNVTDAANYRIYVPPVQDAPTVRGVVLLLPGTGGDWRFRADDFVWQEAARTLGFAVVGGDQSSVGQGYTVADTTTVLNNLLSAAAVATGRPELVNVPVIPTGFSAGGFSTNNYVSRVPARCLAGAAHRGNYTTGYTDPAPAQPVPLLWLPGSYDTNSLTSPTAEAGNFPLFRSAATASNGRAAFAIDWQCVHDSFANQGWSMAWTWIWECAALRYPQPTVPSKNPNTPATLLDIPLGSGWLGQRYYLSDPNNGNDYTSFTPIAPYASYSATAPGDASWLPDETAARVYRAFNSYDGGTANGVIPLQGTMEITGDCAPSTTVQPGQTNPPQMAVWEVGSAITITVNPRQFGTSHPITKMEYYDGTTLLGTQTASVGGVWSWPQTLGTAGIHSITANATDNVGNQTSTFRTVVAMTPYAKGQSLFRFERLPGFTQDTYHLLTLAANTGPTQVTLPATTGAGSHFPKAFDGANGTNTSAAKFVAANSDFLQHLDSAVLPSGTQPFTIEGFVNLASSGSGTTFRGIASQGGASTTDMSWQLIITGEGSGQGARRLLFQFTADGKGQTAGSLETINSGFTLTVGVDYYVAVVVTPTDTSANGIRFYFQDLTNGGSLQTAGFTHTHTTLWNSSQNFLVGSQMDGLLDEVRLTDQALTANGLLINQVVSPLPAGLQGWRYTYFGTLQNTGSAADLADPDGDGVCNLLEYALGTNPTVGSAKAIPTTKVMPVNSQPYLTLTFTRPTTATDVTYTVEVAGDLAGPWTSIDPLSTANQVSVQNDTPSIGLQTITVHDTQPAASAIRRFMRLRATH